MNLFDLVAKITLDSSEYERGISKVKKSFAIAAKASIAAVGAAGATVGTILAKSVKAYGEYEQLVGGAQKIFDQMDYSKIANDAANAWNTMNLSASQYLSMMNSVGATFAATMGDEKGYETAKRGMQAIADYASGTGRNVEELNQKFALITRSSASYQSIADQFSGILPATSKDFLAQAQAAGYLSTKYKELTKVPINEYQEAVSQMLEKGVADLGLAGNTAAETANTITGSLAGMRASWRNLLTAFGSGEDVEAAMGNLAENAKNVVKNVMPVLKTALSGIGKFVKELGPIIVKELPSLAEEILPGLLDAAVSLASSLAGALPGILKSVFTAVSGFMDTLSDWLHEKSPALGTAFDGLRDGAEKVINKLSAFVDWLTSGSIESEAFKAVVVGLGAAFATYSVIMGTVKTITGAVQTAQLLLNAAMSANPIGIVIAGITALVAAFTYLWTTNEDFRNFWITTWDKIKETFNKVWSGIKKVFTEDIPNTFNNAVNFLKELPQKALQWGKDLIQNFVGGIKGKANALKETISGGIAQTIRNIIGFSEPKEGPLSNFHTYAPDMMDLFISGIEGKKEELKKELTTIANVVKNVFDEIRETMSLRQDIAELKYELWEKSYDSSNTKLKNAEKQLADAKEFLERAKEQDGGDADSSRMIRAAQTVYNAREREYNIVKDRTDAEKQSKRAELLSEKILQQAGIVNAASAAWEKIANQYGADSVESLQYQKRLLQEEASIVNLKSELDKIQPNKIEENNVTVNVYGNEGQSPADIARNVVDMITKGIQSKTGAWA